MVASWKSITLVKWKQSVRAQVGLSMFVFGVSKQFMSQKSNYQASGRNGANAPVTALQSSPHTLNITNFPCIVWFSCNKGFCCGVWWVMLISFVLQMNEYTKVWLIGVVPASCIEIEFPMPLCECVVCLQNYYAIMQLNTIFSAYINCTTGRISFRLG